MSFFKLVNLVIIFGCVGSLLLCTGFLSLQRAGAILPRLLLAAVSLAAEHTLEHMGFGSCGCWALEPRLNSCGSWA